MQSQPGVGIGGGRWLLEQPAGGRKGSFRMLGGGGVSVSDCLRVFWCRCPQVPSLLSLRFWLFLRNCSKFLGLQVLASGPFSVFVCLCTSLISGNLRVHVSLCDSQCFPASLGWRVESQFQTLPCVRKKVGASMSAERALGDDPVERLIVHADAETEGQRGAGNSKEGLQQSWDPEALSPSLWSRSCKRGSACKS